MSISLWKPEPDVLIHQALGKLAEECAELSQALARCLIQGYHEDEPVSHKLNRIQVREEIADVKAAMRWLSQLVGEAWGESPREARKLAGFQQWQHMLEADMATPQDPQSCGLADPNTRDCPNMKEVGGGMDGERYSCSVCGKGYFLDYEEMK